MDSSAGVLQRVAVRCWLLAAVNLLLDVLVRLLRKTGRTAQRLGANESMGCALHYAGNTHNAHTLRALTNASEWALTAESISSVLGADAICESELAAASTATETLCDCCCDMGCQKALGPRGRSRDTHTPRELPYVCLLYTSPSPRDS